MLPPGVRLAQVLEGIPVEELGGIRWPGECWGGPAAFCCSLLPEQPLWARAGVG